MISPEAKLFTFARGKKAEKLGIYCLNFLLLLLLPSASGSVREVEVNADDDDYVRFKAKFLERERMKQAASNQRSSTSASAKSAPVAFSVREERSGQPAACQAQSLRGTSLSVRHSSTGRSGLVSGLKIRFPSPAGL